MVLSHRERTDRDLLELAVQDHPRRTLPRGPSQANRFVRRTMALGVGTDVDGGIPGSFPINGAYGRYMLLNWASKFFIDSNVLEQQL